MDPGEERVDIQALVVADCFLPFGHEVRLIPEHGPHRLRLEYPSPVLRHAIVHDGGKNLQVRGGAGEKTRPAGLVLGAGNVWQVGVVWYDA